MRKTLVLILTVILLAGAFLISCNSDAASSDKLVKVTIAGNSKGISVSGISDNPDEYFWYYTATKQSGVYRTGQTSGWTAVNTQGGFAGASLGRFSSGEWIFGFRAYATAPTTTEEFDSYSYYYTSPVVNLTADTAVPVTMNKGNSLRNARLVFPTVESEYLNWCYSPESNTDFAATASALQTRKAYMKVYYVTANSETETLIATSATSAISVVNNTVSAEFTDFTGVSTNTEMSLAEGTYDLVFKVYATASLTANPSENDQQIGETITEHVTASKGVDIRVSIASGDDYAVDDNESGYHVIIGSTYNTVYNISEATINAPVVPSTPATPTEDGSNTNTQKSAATTIITSKTAVEVEETKQSSVSIPAEALADSTVTVTKSGNDVTTTTISSTHTLSMKVETEDVSTSGTTYVVNAISVGNAPVVGIDLDMTKITTTTIQSTNADPTQTEEESKVTEFNNKYLTIATFIEPNLEGVEVVYDGPQDKQPVFDKTENASPNVATASGNSSSSNAGTGYDPETGLLVFKTNHFSSFYVARKADAKIVRDNTDVYYQTLADAVDNLLDGDTIVIMRNLDFSTPAYSGYKWAGSVYNPLEILADDVTLDLNEHIISNMGNSAIAFGHLLAKDGRVSNVKIKNGTLSAGTTDNVTNSYVLLIAGADGAVIEDVTTIGGINVCSGSTGVVIDSCHVTGTKYYTVCAQTGSQVTIQGTSYTKNTDNTVANKSMFWIQGAATDSDMVTPSNPTGAFGASSITILSGEFTVDTSNGGVFYLASGVKPVVKGGTYNIDPTAYLAEGYTVVENGTLYDVVPAVTVSFDANGGQGSMSNQIIAKNVSTALNDNSFEKSGYNFTGWNTEANGSGTAYTDKQNVTLDTALTLYAQWESKINPIITPLTFTAIGDTGLVRIYNGAGLIIKNNQSGSEIKINGSSKTNTGYLYNAGGYENYTLSQNNSQTNLGTDYSDNDISITINSDVVEVEIKNVHGSVSFYKDFSDYMYFFANLTLRLICPDSAKNCEVTGNVMSLLYGSTFTETFKSGDKYSYFTYNFGKETEWQHQFTGIGESSISSDLIGKPKYEVIFDKWENALAGLFNDYNLNGVNEHAINQMVVNDGQLVLPAKVLGKQCYQNMFYNCAGLNSITCLATNLSGNYTSSWMYGVPSSGTFIQAEGASWSTGTSGIPEGWDVITQSN